MRKGLANSAMVPNRTGRYPMAFWTPNVVCSITTRMMVRPLTASTQSMRDFDTEGVSTVAIWGAPQLEKARFRPSLGRMGRAQPLEAFSAPDGREGEWLNDDHVANVRRAVASGPRRSQPHHPRALGEAAARLIHDK